MRGFPRAIGTWIADLLRDPTANRARRFAQALVLAAELPADVDQLYIHFLHTPGSVGRYAAMLRGLPYCLSAHAKDIWTTPAWEKRAKLQGARWAVTCTATNLDHLRAIAPSVDIELVRHGIDLARFGPPAHRPADPPVILCVARAVEKKGLDTLLEALARLPDDLAWRLEHIGGGPLSGALRSQAERLAIASRVSWLGPLDQESVLQAYRRASLLTLPARVAADGDRDGLPNVIVEAMSQGLPVVSTRVSAIPELVEDGVNGLLVQPGDPAALAGALERLLREPALRRQLGSAGSARVHVELGKDRGIDRIAARLRDLPLTTTAFACASPSMPR
jgi:glycosyltransferase involved in cell wall biosynthesis